jgi:general secretion pathway protein D
VIRANAADYAKIKKTLETLDIIPRAVLIEVVIIEVVLNKDMSYGVEWLFRAGDFATVFRNRNTISPGTGTDSGTGGTSGGFDLNKLATTSFALFAGDVTSLAALIQALASKTDVRILSAPTLLATDNKEASITVGGREPIPTSSALGSDTGGTLLTGINYEETGIILNVTPHINAGGLVRLELEQTIRRTGASKTVGSGDAQAPTFTERNVKTTLLAQDASTVVIGGIIEEGTNTDKSGIPFLQDIPLLSPLFSVQSKRRARTELLIAVTPHVIDKKDSARTREFVERLRQLRRQLDADRSTIR